VIRVCGLQGKIEEWERELLERNEGRRAQENRRKYLRQPHSCPPPLPTSSHGVGASSPSSSGHPNMPPQASRPLPSYLFPSEVAHAKQQQAHGGFSRAPGGAVVGGGAHWRSGATYSLMGLTQGWGTPTPSPETTAVTSSTPLVRHQNSVRDSTEV
jgi:hypothetical protein